MIFYNFAPYFDKMVNWPQRLEREGPFFRRLFGEVKARKVLDIGCATGHHALLFAGWGLEVVASDISPEMIGLARENGARAGLGVDWRVAGFNDVGRIFAPGSFDAVTCLGNTLPHLLTGEELMASIKSVHRALSPGGLYIFQIRNYQKVLSRKEKFMPINSWKGQDEEIIFIRMTDFPEKDPGMLDFSILILHKREGKWEFHVENERLHGWREGELSHLLKQAGFEDMGLYGSYQGDKYDPGKSPDLIVVARKPALES